MSATLTISVIDHSRKMTSAEFAFDIGITIIRQPITVQRKRWGINPIIIIALLFCFTLFFSHSAHAYSCNVSVTSTGVLYTGSNVDSNGTVTLNCTRNTSEANTLTYRLKANDGLHQNGTQRRVQLSAPISYINYYLARGTAVGGSATCSNSSTWEAPATGTGSVITGTLSFGSNLNASALWGYCVRVRSTSPSPTAGTYTDIVQVTGQFPNSDSGTLTTPSPLSYTVGVGNQCVFNTFPTDINFAYTSFSTTAQTSSQTFSLRCSNTLPWSLSVTPASSTLLGLNYNLSLSPTSGTGTGLNQTATLTGTIPAGQAGTCSTAVCTGTNMHTVTITY